jgi:hypothetical protein
VFFLDPDIIIEKKTCQSFPFFASGGQGALFEKT